MPLHTDPIALFLLISALVAACGFVGQYAVNSPWRRNEVGRSMMMLACSLVLIIGLGICLQVLGPDYRFRGSFRSFTYLFLNVALWWQLCLLIRVQNRRYPPVTEEASDKDLVA